MTAPVEYAWDARDVCTFCLHALAMHDTRGIVPGACSYCVCVKFTSEAAAALEASVLAMRATMRETSVKNLEWLIDNTDGELRAIALESLTLIKVLASGKRTSGPRGELVAKMFKLAERAGVLLDEQEDVRHEFAERHSRAIYERFDGAAGAARWFLGDGGKI